MAIDMTSVSLKQLILDRRTCYQFSDLKSYPVTDENIYDCLEAARWAPNHKLTQPWRFWIVDGKSKRALADIYAENRALKKAEKHSDSYQELYLKAVDKFMAIPKVVLVGQVINKNPVVQKEDYAACACAIQNFQLMAWSLNMGVQWSTGPIINDQRTYNYLDQDSTQLELIGALYLGHRKQGCQGLNSKRNALKECVTHLK